jgi:hypothetical protein
MRQLCQNIIYLLELLGGAGMVQKVFGKEINWVIRLALESL